MQRLFVWVIFLLGIGALFSASQGQPGAAGYAFSSAVFAQEMHQAGDRAAADGPLYRDVTEAARIDARHGGIWRDYATEPCENAYLAAGSAWADYDNDGWVDFLVGNWNQGYRLYHNEGVGGGGNHWLTVDLEGGGFINRDAIGARVYVVTADGEMQMREVRSGSSIGTSHDLRAHFGLGDATIDHVRVVWTGGPVQVHTDVEPDQILHIEPFWEWVQ